MHELKIRYVRRKTEDSPLELSVHLLNETDEIPKHDVIWRDIFTGLPDVEGKDIFNGDIVESDWGYKFEIFFDDGAFKTDSEDFEFLNAQNIRRYNLTVVGNIHENKILLES